MLRKCKRTRALPVKKATDKNAATLKRLRSFLDAKELQAVKWLVRFWDEQQGSISYREIREAILSGDISITQLEEWQREYAALVNEKLAPQWLEAMSAAADDIKRQHPYFLYDSSVEAAQSYIRERGAQLVTNLVSEQRNAIREMVSQAAHYEAMTADSLSRIIRPVIGLTTPQVVANMRYYNSVLEATKNAHPRMTTANAERKAREAAIRYAARQHRYRAMCIARTELASTYNQGSHGAIKNAQAHGYIGDCKKTWLTADDERVCPVCGGADGESVNMNAWFSIGVLLPPAHPQCRCAVAYEEIN